MLRLALFLVAVWVADAFVAPAPPGISSARGRPSISLSRIKMYTKGPGEDQDGVEASERGRPASKKVSNKTSMKRSQSEWTLRNTETASTTTAPSVPGELELDALSPATVVFNTLLITVLKGVIDIIYKGRDFQRFYVLETVARVPYFSYMSVLHFYETVGWHRKANWIKVHYAEADNELHHLLIMESLGGSKEVVDRLLAGNAAVAYYWLVVVMYMVNPRGAYHLSQLIEDHAWKTYDKFLKENEEFLKAQNAPQVAIDYYMGPDMYMFDSFHTARAITPRRPKIKNLFDVFCNIRDDEDEHRSTLKQLVDEGRICSKECTPSAACYAYAENCSVDDLPTARGKGTQYSTLSREVESE